MLCPEGCNVENKYTPKDNAEESWQNKTGKMPVEGIGSVELNSYKTPKTWKKSISNFFRNQLRKTKSQDGDRPSGSNESFEVKEVSREQKWQSLGKIFRRQTLEQRSKATNTQGECSSANKRLAVKNVLSCYFGKKTSDANDK